jgi:tetratricopeptide (TPR) repeat protein
MTRVIPVFLCLALCAGCDNEAARKAKKAERLYYVVFRDLEEQVETLPETIAQYAEISREYGDTPSGKKAAKRHDQLLKAQALLAGSDSLGAGQWVPVYTRVDSAAPGYPPVVRALGRHFFNNTYLASRSGAMTRHPTIIQTVLKIWGQQDSLWSKYEFRPTETDKAWRDKLCRQAIDVARMLEGARRYGEALHVVSRGLEYGVGEGAIALARVFAAYYTFRAARYGEGVDLARKALAYEFLDKDDRARAHHVLGLCYWRLSERGGGSSDLQKAIDALNEALRIDPELTSVRELLKELRLYQKRNPA